MPHSISYEAKPKPQELQLLGEGIMENARLKKGMEPIDFFTFFVRDDKQSIVGGCNGDLLYGCLYVGQLWVAESLRGQGYGTQLMSAAEQWGKERGCSFSTVNTMDWEALEFYKKLGYAVEFERHGFSKDSVFYFLRKEFK